MIENPILIKRPLIRVDGMSIQGFMDERLPPYLGSWDRKDDVVTCPNLLSLSCDDKHYDLANISLASFLCGLGV